VISENALSGIEKPGRYIGNEINTCTKAFEEAGIRFALAFPDVYEVGLSHLGLQVLYHLLNHLDGVLADRVYAPWIDFERKLRSRGEPLCGIETGRPLSDFDFVGFSLQYELSYTNILTMLHLAGIPFEARNRRSGDPLIIGGGPCAFNPEPLADFFDFLVLGEGEEVLLELIDHYRKWAKSSSGLDRRRFLQEITAIPGIYVPSLFHISYRADGTIAGIAPLHAPYTGVGKRVVKDLDHCSPIPEKPLVPLLDIVHNRLGIEIARGCTRGCRFCQAGFIYRPVRERDPVELSERAQRALLNSGFEEMSLLSLSTGDYSQIQPLLLTLMDRLAPKKIAVSFPSMRVGTLTPELMEAILKVRKTGFTLAPEAGSERLRRVINKGIRDEDLLEAAKNAFGLGWRLLKLYFMTGLPTETREDLDALVDLCFRVWELAKPTRSSINVSVSVFVPKSHTPFQWAPQIPTEEMVTTLNELKGRLRRAGMRVKWQNPQHSFLEGVFARGDRRLGKAIVRAWELGARFDAWSELFREEPWIQAFKEAQIDPRFYALRERSLDEVLPWDHLSAGVQKGFLRAEYERAIVEEHTPDCRWSICSNCGVCDHKTIAPQLHREPLFTAEPVKAPVSAGLQRIFPYRLRYSKIQRARFLGQLELAQVFERSIRRAGLPAAFTEGFHPHVKLSFSGALPLGLESLVEEAYMNLSENVPPALIATALNAQLPVGLRIEEVVPVVKRANPHHERRVTYAISHLSSWVMHSLVQNWRRHLHESLAKKTKKGEIRVLLADILLDVRQTGESALELDLFESDRICFRPLAILQHFSLESIHALEICRMCKISVVPFRRDENPAAFRSQSFSHTL